ncbi:retinal dehydrogenase 1 [Fusarium oxysporum]|nr:retinal dehydrogenase 1 [Fusarium oxysporum]
MSTPLELFSLSWGMYPRRVLIYLAEKNLLKSPLIKVTEVTVCPNSNSLTAPGKPKGTAPILRLPDGKFIKQSIAILEYFEDICDHPQQPWQIELTKGAGGSMLGRTAEEKARVREVLGLADEVTSQFGFACHKGTALFNMLEETHPVTSKLALEYCTKNLKLLEKYYEEDTRFNGGDGQVTIADCVLYSTLHFAKELYSLDLLADPELLIGASDGSTFPLFNPATGDKVANVPEATRDDVNNAVAAAQRAFPAWSALDPAKRGGYMKKLAGLIRQHNDELALLEAKSMGRPLPEFFEGYAAAGSYEYYAEAWPHIQGQASLNTPGYVTMTLRQPFGVVGAIIPWNAALLFFAGKTAPALITGNTVVLKSSEKAPLGAAKFAELIHKAGFPPGVFNVISGHGNPSGAALSSHMDVRAISFTGSGRTGRAIQEAAAKSNLKKVILELGGKSPVIIFDDADIEQAAKDTMHSIQWNSGQVCMANSRVYVQDTISEKFIEASKKALSAAKPGDPTQKGVDHGPQADKTQYETVLSYIDEGKKSGKLVQGGKGSYDKTGGFFIEPTIFLDTAENAKIMKEEIFGPVVNINVIKTEEEAIQKANDTEYGLYAAVYTKNIDRAMRVTQQLNSGYVGINCTSPTTARDLPFGGYKSSGQGREGYLYSMDNFLEVKSVMMKVDAGGPKL